MHCTRRTAAAKLVFREIGTVNVADTSGVQQLAGRVTISDINPGQPADTTTPTMGLEMFMPRAAPPPHQCGWLDARQDEHGSRDVHAPRGPGQWHTLIELRALPFTAAHRKLLPALTSDRRKAA